MCRKLPWKWKITRKTRMLFVTSWINEASFLSLFPLYVSLFAFRSTRMTLVLTGRRYFRRASWTWRRRRPSDLFSLPIQFFFLFRSPLLFNSGIFRQDSAVCTIYLTIRMKSSRLLISSSFQKILFIQFLTRKFFCREK